MESEEWPWSLLGLVVAGNPDHLYLCGSRVTGGSREKTEEGHCAEGGLSHKGVYRLPWSGEEAAGDWRSHRPSFLLAWSTPESCRKPEGSELLCWGLKGQPLGVKMGKETIGNRLCFESVSLNAWDCVGCFLTGLRACLSAAQSCRFSSVPVRMYLLTLFSSGLLFFHSYFKSACQNPWKTPGTLITIALKRVDNNSVSLPIKNTDFVYILSLI